MKKILVADFTKITRRVGDTLYLPVGAYCLDGTFQIPKGVTKVIGGPTSLGE